MSITRKILLATIIVVVAQTIVSAQGPNRTLTFDIGGFGYLTSFGSNFDMYPGVGTLPSPIFDRTANVGKGSFGGPPAPIHIEAAESVRLDPSSPDGLIQIQGTINRLYFGDPPVVDSLFGTYLCQTQSKVGNLTWNLECTVTITGGRGGLQGVTGSGTMTGTFQLFPVNSIAIVQVSKLTGGVILTPF